MLRIFLSLTVAFCLAAGSLSGQLPAPGAFLPHEHGQQFTPHYILVDYVEHVAENSPRVQLVEYGRTPEARPLLLAFISTAENLARLEDIRRNNLRYTGLLAGEPDRALDKAIVWMSFGVHGNEAGASEASLSVLYELARADNKDVLGWLENTIVILDPCLNPDGFSRYTDWYRRIATQNLAPGPDAYEHDEPWPGGRVNHYLFDLNRDWAWQTQTETQSRIKVYREWMPHIHVDFHEQFPNDHYYFAPAAPPYHPYISDWQAAFQYDIGKNHASYFDQEGWLYFTREVFDLLYPSYGDTYPTFNGSIGMTYEQAGHGVAGRAYIMENGDTLTLRDRIRHHTTTALSTLEVASENAGRIVDNFKDYFQQANNAPVGEYKTFIIRGDNPPGRLRAFLDLLDKNGIRYGRAEQAGNIWAYNYQSGEEESLFVDTGDLVISAYQPLSVLAQALLEPQPQLEDTLTYDITAWALPYAYGLEAYASAQRLDAASPWEAKPYDDNLEAPAAPYAYLMEWSSVSEARFLAALLQQGIKARFAKGAFSMEGRPYDAGTVVFTYADNRKMGASRFKALITAAAREFEQPVTPVNTGFSDAGFDLGSSNLEFIETPRVAVLAGKEADANSYGEVWHFFEQGLGYPLFPISPEVLTRISLSDFNVLILPEGDYDIDSAAMASLQEWIERGGRLIAIGAALSALEDKEGFSLSRYATQEAQTRAREEGEEAILNSRLDPFASQIYRYISRSIPGALFKLQLDHTHPLAYGLDHYFSLKTSSNFYPLLGDHAERGEDAAPASYIGPGALEKNTWNVGYIGESPEVAGFAGSEALRKAQNTVVFAVQDKGKGAVIYMVDNPLFRGFWENGRFLFCNALFFAGQ